MNLADIIKENNLIKKNMPIKLSSLKKFIREKSNKEYTTSAIRNVFIGNNDYYGFKYQNGFNRAEYIPMELKTFSEIIAKINPKIKHMEAGLSLLYKLGYSMQNIVIHSWYIFSKYTKKLDKILSFYPIFKYEFIDIEDEEIFSFKILNKIKVARFSDNDVKNIIKDKKITKKQLLFAYNLYLENIKNNDNSSWDIFTLSNKPIEISILKAITYAKK